MGIKGKMRFKRKERGKSLKYFLLGAVGVFAVAAIVWVLVAKLEGEAPRIVMDFESGHIPARMEIPVTVYDEKSGIRKVFASLVQDGREVTLANRTYGQSMFGGESGVHALDLTLSIDVREKGLKDGEALLRIAAWDLSWRQRFSGNLTYMEKEIVIDSMPPRITVLSRQHNLSQGGSGLVIYRLSEPCEKHGVRVGEEFFQGYTGYYKDEDIYLALIALSHEQGVETGISLFAEDKAGNQGQSGLHYYIQNRAFDSENLNISDNFLRQALPEFHSVAGFPVEEAPIDQFLFINRDLRKKNSEILLSLYKDSANTFYWEGGFMALPRAQRRAGFADQRTYIYNGEAIGQSVHLGVDLASLRHAPVPAANAGKVVFCDWAGIYGNTVVIDHGYGLMSLYSHLSGIDVQKGDFVAKGDIVGNTGMTGLAVGDHLHFSVIVGNVFVNPYEWWDAAWIQNNITGKLDEIKQRL